MAEAAAPKTPRTEEARPEPPLALGPLRRSLAALIAGSFLLRGAAGAMSQNIQFYLNAIHEAALSPTHPLRLFAGAGRVYHISYALGGVIIGSFFAAELIGALWLGAWSDRYGRKLFILLGPLLGALAVQITAVTTVVWFLILTRLLEGLSTASNTPATLGYLAEATAYSPKLRTRLAGFFEVATVGGMALGFTLGGWLWRHYGMPAIVAGLRLTSPAFALNGVVYLVSFTVLALGVKEIGRPAAAALPKTALRQTLRHYWQIVSAPRVAGFVPAWIAINAVLGVWINLTARLLTDKTGFAHQLLAGHFDSLQAGYILTAYAAFFVLGILIWSLFLAQVKKVSAMLIGTAGLFISCGVLFALNHQPALDAPLVRPLALLLVISIMIQSGFTPAALTHLADITENHTADRGAIMGLYSVFLGLGQFLGASVGGPFVDWLGADGLVAVTALLGLFAAAMLIRLRTVENRPTPLAPAGLPPA